MPDLSGATNIIDTDRSAGRAGGPGAPSLASSSGDLMRETSGGHRSRPGIALSTYEDAKTHVNGDLSRQDIVSERLVGNGFRFVETLRDLPIRNEAWIPGMKMQVSSNLAAFSTKGVKIWDHRNVMISLNSLPPSR